MSPLRSLGTAMVLLADAGCVDDGWTEVKLAEIHYWQGQPEIDAPASAPLGEPVIVRFTAVGSTCNTFERTDVESIEDGADIFPRHRIKHPAEGTVCPSGPLIHVPHAATLTFHTPGAKTIRIHGIRREGFQERVVEIPLGLQVQ